jgi:hypothetical protein
MQPSDFAEYVNGPITTKWGALRARHGHPAMQTTFSDYLAEYCPSYFNFLIN